MSRNPISLLLVLVQSLMLTVLFLSGPVVPTTLLSGIFFLIGFLLLFWAFWTMRTSTFQITPDLAPGSILVTNGPYSFTRHPMYGGIMLISISLLLNSFDTSRLIAVVILFADLLFKASLEDHYLEKHFGKEYKNYEEKTQKLIPFIY